MHSSQQKAKSSSEYSSSCLQASSPPSPSLSKKSAMCPPQKEPTTMLPLGINWTQMPRRSSSVAPLYGPSRGPNRDPLLVSMCFTTRGVRYIRENLSKADISAFLKLSATYRYQKIEFQNNRQNYRYRKMHQILADK